MTDSEPLPYVDPEEQVFLRGAHCATGPLHSDDRTLAIRGGRIHRILSSPASSRIAARHCVEIDLTDFLLLPGFINAHDHLEFALFPRLAAPPYRNYVEWGEDIHRQFTDVIATHRAVPKDVRIWWGGIRNLLCGVTTVSHHNPLRSVMLSAAFPVRVVRHYGWAHSPALGGDLRQAHAATPEGAPFIMHACEGTDDLAREELRLLDRLGLLDAHTILVHGLALDHSGVALLRERKTSLIVCPSSNRYLFGALPDLSLLSTIDNVALGNDSPLTAKGDLLDEIRFAIGACDITPQVAYSMVTTAPATILRLGNAEGTLQDGGIADVIAVRNTGQEAAERLLSLTIRDVEFVMIGGRVQLASHNVLERLPPRVRKGLEPLSIDGITRWLRAPVAELLERAKQALGADQVRVGTRDIAIPASAESGHAA